MDGLPGGAYDELITAGLEALLRRSSEETATDRLDPAESTEVLAAHLEKIAARVLGSLPVERRLAVANEVLTRLIDETGRATSEDLVVDPPKMLYSVGPATDRPQNPFGGIFADGRLPTPGWWKACLTHDSPDRLHRISAPTLVLHAGADWT